MKKIGSRIYYEITTGHVLVNTGDRETFDDYVAPSVESDFNTFLVLKNRKRETVGVMDFPYGKYAEAFNNSNGYRVNLETKELEFSYPNPDYPTIPPVFQKPLTEQIVDLEAQNNGIMIAVAELAMANEQDKIETQLAIAELATLITGGFE